MTFMTFGNLGEILGVSEPNSSISELHTIVPSSMLIVREKTLDTEWQMLEAT